MFFGRKQELALIRKAISSNRADLIILYGRRRIGKSTLLSQARQGKGCLFFEALQKTPQKKQINHFLAQLSEQTATPLSQARDWREAFDVLSYHISRGRKYVIFDEFPWMASERSELVSLLKYFWDNRWKKNSKLTLVICGSVASFMLKHIVHSKALHNRKTLEIKLQPLSAKEAKGFFGDYRSNWEIAKFLMIFGGIPKYLEQLDPKRSFAENLDLLCFNKNGFFLNEFETVFKEQFKVVRNYEKIVRALAQNSLSKVQLAKRIEMQPGGGLTSYIDTLQQADFVHTFSPVSILGKGSKTKRIVLWDEWLRFYFTWIAKHRDVIELNTKPGLFERLTSMGMDTYLGLCFEKLCIKNLPQIIEYLGFDLHQVLGYGPFFRQAPRKNKSNSGLQIDLLIRRRGLVLTLVECKFSSRPIGSNVIEQVKRKVSLLKAPSEYSVERVLISASDVSKSVIDSGYFHQIVGLDAIFD
jgi:AAA+ ATPase superfamily predicted ATPase